MIYSRGTALSRHTPLQSSTFTSPAPANPPTNTIQDDQLPMITADNDTDSLPNPSSNNTQTESRRPRVYFADFNRILFLEDNHEITQQHQTPVQHSHRHHRRRLTKKTSNSNGTNHITPSIQHTQTLQNFSRPLSRQPNHSLGEELNIRKQQLFASPRPYSSRLGHLPEILNQSLPIEPTSHEKHPSQREKSVVRPSKSIIENPNALVTHISPEDRRPSISHSPPLADSLILTHESECGEHAHGLLVHGSPSVSQTSINRPRPSLRTISLRQQFISSMKSKPTGVTNTNPYHQQLNTSLLNPRRSASLKQSTNENDDPRSNNGSSSNMESNRSIISNRSVKPLKRSDVIHFNSKNPLGGNAMNDSTRTHVHEPTPERFQNLLTVVRPPYAAGNGFSPTITPIESTIHSIHHHHSMGNYRSTRATSAREAFGYHPTSNTILV